MHPSGIKYFEHIHFIPENKPRKANSRTIKLEKCNSCKFHCFDDTKIQHSCKEKCSFLPWEMVQWNTVIFYNYKQNGRSTTLYV